jgi:hypothetical protein
MSQSTKSFEMSVSFDPRHPQKRKKEEREGEGEKKKRIYLGSNPDPGQEPVSDQSLEHVWDRPVRSFRPSWDQTRAITDQLSRAFETGGEQASLPESAVKTKMMTVAMSMPDHT